MGVPQIEDACPVGVFDSGVGGLSVLCEIRRELPQEDLIYVADSGHAPYGDRPREFIEARSVAIAEFLVTQKVKAIVVACNTATGATIATLRARFALPIVGMEPAIKPAINISASRVIGVMATSGTLAGDKFAELLARFAGGVDVLVQPCPGLVEQVEAGDLSGEKTRALLERHLQPLLQRRVDTIVLGCTHYPFLAPLIREIAGTTISVVDPSPAIARELRRRLELNNLLSGNSRAGAEQFWTTGHLDGVKTVMEDLWCAPVDVRRMK